MTSTSGGTRLSLLSRARARDAAAWRDLVQLYSPLVAYWCRRCGLDTHDTADCLQEVFTSVATSLDRFQPQATSGAFRAWLWTITRNKVRDLLRRNVRQPGPVGGSTAQQLLGRYPDESSLPVEEPADAGQISALWQRGLEQVRGEFEPRTWQSFWRTAIDGVATAVVADQLGLSSSAVRQNRARVMRRLREQLGDRDDR